MSGAIISFQNICVDYGGRHVLSEVSGGISAGEVVGLVGPNGAGKSTLVRTLLGLIQPKSGTISLNGKSLSSHKRSEIARMMAYVPQGASSGFPVSVFEAVLAGRTPHMVARVTAEDTAICERVLESLRLEKYAERMMSELSGGERQRVMLARALAQQTQLIILDEPTSALDIGNQLFTLRTVADVVRQSCSAAFIAIHDLSLAARFVDRVMLLKGGALMADGSWQNALSQTHIRKAYGVDAPVVFHGSTPSFIPYEI